jgi:molybdate transport system ATP-binding protein
MATGMHVRIRVPAREVILATAEPVGLSLHNVLPATVRAVEQDTSLGQAIVQLQVGGVRLLAEVTGDAVAQLDIVEGRRVYALIKSVSLEVRAQLPRIADV